MGGRICPSPHARGQAEHSFPWLGLAALPRHQAPCTGSLLHTAHRYHPQAQPVPKEASCHSEHQLSHSVRALTCQNEKGKNEHKLEKRLKPWSEEHIINHRVPSLRQSPRDPAGLHPEGREKPNSVVPPGRAGPPPICSPLPSGSVLITDRTGAQRN